MDQSNVVPFRALRYSTDAVGDPGAVWAPPYDVIGAADAAALRGRSPYNIVHVTNPEGEAPERYVTAARTLESWMAQGVMARDDTPAFLVHQREFDYAGGRLVRTGVWALLRLQPFDAGVVMHHERTMKGPKKDRLSLMRACSAQLSPIFFICSDGDGRVSNVIKDVVGTAPLESTEFPATQHHKVWRTEYTGAAVKLAAMLNGQNFLIADGHHRYETAQTYRDALIGEGAPQTGGHAHEYVLAYIVPDSDPGLLLLPAHRAVGGEPLDWESAVQSVSGRFDVVEVGAADLGQAAGWLDEAAGQPAFVLVARDRPGGWLLKLKNPDVYTGIASVAFHEVFLSEGLGLTAEQQVERMSYLKDSAETLETVQSGGAQAAVLLAAPRVTQVREAAALGHRTPPKTTFFWPKVPTGVAVHLVRSAEVV